MVWSDGVNEGVKVSVSVQMVGDINLACVCGWNEALWGVVW